MIMVDELTIWGPAVGYWRNRPSSHMTTDGSVEELHAFAAAMGLRREWYQAQSTPHYDLTDKRRAVAIRLGAVFVPAREQARRRLVLRPARVTP